MTLIEDFSGVRIMFDNTLESVVISSRIRVARNIAGRNFTQNFDPEFSLNLVNKVADTVMPLGKYKVYRMSAISDFDSELMCAKHLISRELIKNKETGASIIREDEAVSIMVNEEDHIREQCILKGLNLDGAFRLISEIDDELDANLDFAYDEKFGYLTSCLTNTGTGLRASVMLFLPALTINSKIDSIIKAVKEKGLTVRGVLGEGSFPLGYMYQVSNAVTIGVSEREIIANVKTAVLKIVEMELTERKKMIDKFQYCATTDIVWRAWGILTNCYTIDYAEFMKLVGEVKLGISLGIIVLNDNKVVDRLIEYGSDLALMKIKGKMMTIEETAKFRAENLYKQLKNNRIK